MHEEDWDAIVEFCDQVNRELEGPQIAIRLLAHKIQSPTEREALYALSVSKLAHKIVTAESTDFLLTEYKCKLNQGHLCFRYKY